MYKFIFEKNEFTQALLQTLKELAQENSCEYNISKTEKYSKKRRRYVTFYEFILYSNDLIKNYIIYQFERYVLWLNKLYEKRNILLGEEYEQS